MTKPEFDFLPDTPRRLARLVEVTAAADQPWLPEEFGAIWRHLLRAPLQLELGEIPSGDAPPSEKTDQTACRISLHDLLHQDKPPAELLRLTKEFAKAKRRDPSAPFPKEIARVLYFGAILLALLRCKVRISELTDADLRKGIAWTLTQTWLDAETLDLFKEGCRYLSPGGAAGEGQKDRR